MFCLWMSLICAAALIQSVSSDDGVKLNCSKPVEVVAGDTVTLNCTVYFQNLVNTDCEVLQVIWSNTSSKTPCYSGSSKYICGWNHQTNVSSLIISNVTKQENYTVTVETDCGDDTSMINVQVKHTGVKLNCSETMEVVAGDTVTLECNVYHNTENSDCEVLQVIWSNTSSKIPCDSGSSKYICDWNHQSSVSLTISNVKKEENGTVTVQIRTDCGDDWAMIKLVSSTNYTQGHRLDNNQKTIIAICGVIIFVILLYFLFRRCSKEKEIHEGYSEPDDPDTKPD